MFYILQKSQIAPSPSVYICVANDPKKRAYLMKIRDWWLCMTHTSCFSDDYFWYIQVSFYDMPWKSLLLTYPSFCYIEYKKCIYCFRIFSPNWRILLLLRDIFVKSILLTTSLGPLISLLFGSKFKKNTAAFRKELHGCLNGRISNVFCISNYI